MGRLKHFLHFLLCYVLFATQAFAQIGLNLPQCKRPERSQQLLDGANAKYNPQLMAFDQEIMSLTALLPSVKQKVEDAKRTYDQSLKDPGMSVDQKANYKEHLEIAIANQKNLEFQIDNKQTQKFSLKSQRDSELTTIVTGKQYDNIEQYLKMAVSMDGMEEGAKGIEIMAVADVGRRLSCQMVGDKMPPSYSLFKDASSTFALSTVDDTRNYVSQLQLDMMNDCATFEDAKNAQLESLKSLLTQKSRLLVAVGDKISTIKMLADGYEPALEAARREQADKESRIREAKVWVREAEIEVMKAKSKVKLAEKKVKDAEQDLEDALAALEKAKKEKKKAEDKKNMLLMAAMAAAMIAMMMKSKATGDRATASATAGTPAGPPNEAKATQSESDAKKAEMKKMMLMLALALAMMALMQKEKDLTQEEQNVREAKKALQQAKNELMMAEEELAQKEAELAQANEELDLANIHTKLKCAINGNSEFGVSGETDDGGNENSLNADNMRADKFIAQFISAHEGRQPTQFVEVQTRIEYLEYVTGLSTTGTRILEKAQRNIQTQMTEIQGIIAQQGANTNVSLASTATASSCLNSSGQIDLNCNCRTTNSCYNTSSNSGVSFNSTGAISGSKGSISLGGNIGAALVAQAGLLNALSAGNQAAAKVSKEQLKKAANAIRQEVAKRGGAKITPSFKLSKSNAALGSTLPSSGGSLSPGVNLGASADVSFGSSSDYKGSSLGGDYGSLGAEAYSGNNDHSRTPAESEYDYDSAGKVPASSNLIGTTSDVGVNDHTNGVSIFDIVSYRYQKSAYPRLFDASY